MWNIDNIKIILLYACYTNEWKLEINWYSFVNNKYKRNISCLFSYYRTKKNDTKLVVVLNKQACHLASIYSLLVLLRYTELFFVLIYTHKAFSFIDRCLYILFFSYTSYFLVFVFFTILSFSLHTLYLEFAFESKLIL